MFPRADITKYHKLGDLKTITTKKESLFFIISRSKKSGFKVLTGSHFLQWLQERILPFLFYLLVAISNLWCSLACGSITLMYACLCLHLIFLFLYILEEVGLYIFICFLATAGLVT